MEFGIEKERKRDEPDEQEEIALSVGGDAERCCMGIKD